MRKTQFAGLTVLDDDESIISDGAAFIGRDRDVIDRMLQLGAKTHRHTGTSGLSNPEQGGLDADVVASGGTLSADLSVTVGFTLEDSDGGETLISPTVTVATQEPLDVPLFAPVGVADYTSGELQVDTYYYGVTYSDGEGGETPLGPTVDVERAPGYANARVLLSGLSEGMATASAANWRLYRAVGGGEFCFLASGTGDTYTDTGTVSVLCDIQPPADEINTTGGTSTLLIALPSGGLTDATFINLYASEDGDFQGPSLLGQYPISSGGVTVSFTDLEPLDFQPPDANLSIGGAHLIDPDTELLEWHWKRPVAGSAALGSGYLGDVRLDTDEGDIYMMLTSPSGSDWTRLQTGGGGGGSGVKVKDEGTTVLTLAETLNFVGSGVTATNAGGGVVTVTIPGGGGAGVGTVHTVEDSLGGLVEEPEHLIFEGFGDGAFVVDEGGGSARIYTGGPGTIYTVGAGPSGVAVDEGGQVSNPIALHFAGSGGINVAVDDLGGGVAEVLIGASGFVGPQGPAGETGPQGPTGPAGAGGTRHQTAGSAGVNKVFDDTYTEFRASGGLSIGTASDLGGGGSASVTVAPLGRMWASATADSLASGGSASIDFTPSAAGMRLLKISTNKRARVRMYGDATKRTADLARAIGTDPSGDHGVLLDYANTATASGRLSQVSPHVDAHNLDTNPLNKTYLNITNYDATGNVVVAFLYVPTEVV